MPFTADDNKLITQKFKSCIVYSAIVISAISVPLAFVSVGKNVNSFFKDEFREINKTLSVVPTFFEQQINEAIPGLKQEYIKGGENLRQHFSNESGTNLLNEWKKGKDALDNTKFYFKENWEEINYYLFTLGNVVKPLISYIPTIIQDSIIYNEKTRSENQLLSIQKAISVSKQSNFKAFVEAVKSLIDKHTKIIEQITVAEGEAIIKILREVREEDFNKFMEQVNKNIEIAKNKTYTNSNDLLKDVFVGADEVSKLKTYIKNLKDKTKELDEQLQTIEGLSKEKLDYFKKVLQELENSIPNTVDSNNN